MNCHETVFREWEQRYQSYQSYRNHYLNVLSISMTIWLIAMGYISRGATTTFFSIILLVILLVIGLGTIIAHHIARLYIRRLGERMTHLEHQIGIKTFRTTSALETALIVSLGGTWTAELITASVLIYYLAR